jgi:cytochrome c
VSAVSAAQAVDPVYAAYTTVRLAFLPVLYLLLVNAPLRQGLIVWPLVAGMIIQGAVGVPQFLFGHTLGLEWLGETVADAASPGVSVVMTGVQRWLRAYGLTPHPNILGGLLMAGLLIVAGYYLTQPGRRRIVLLGSLAVGLGMAGVAQAQDGAALAQKNGCMTCHAVDTKKMGPSFKDAAAKFKGKSDADVAAAVKASKAHGSSKASDADLQALGKWILSL